MSRSSSSSSYLPWSTSPFAPGSALTSEFAHAFSDPAAAAAGPLSDDAAYDLDAPDSREEEMTHTNYMESTDAAEGGNRRTAGITEPSTFAPSRLAGLSPAQITAGGSSGGGGGGSDARRLVHVPRHLAFVAPSPSSATPEMRYYQQHTPVPRVSEEDTEAGESTALLSGGADADSQARRTAMRASSSLGRGSSRPPLPPSASTSLLSPNPLPLTSASSSLAATAASLLSATPEMTYFTPQTRRKVLRERIDMHKSDAARARRARAWCFCFRSNPCSVRRLTLLLILASIMLCTASENILRKLVTSNLYNYRWALFQSVSLLSFVLCAGNALAHRKHIRHYLQHHGIPYVFLLAASLLDSVHALSLVLALGILPPSWGIVVPQLTIPFAMLFRFCVTNGTRVGRFGAAGSILVSIAVCMLIIPGLLNFDPCVGTSSTRSEVKSELLFNVLLLMVGTVPNAASIILKQSWLQSHPMNLHGMNLALSGLQVAWGLMLGPFALELQFVGNNGMQQYHHFAPNAGDGSNAAGGSVSHISSSIDDSSSSSTDAPPVVSNPNQAWTNGVSRNLWWNFQRGWGCWIRGHNSEVGDLCASEWPELPLQFMMLLVSMVLSQVLLAYLMSRSSRENLLALALSLGTLLSILAFNLPFVQSFLPSFELGACLPAFDYLILLALVCLTLGIVVAQWEPSQEPVDLDVWARLEEIAAGEEHEQARRARIKQMAREAQRNATK